MNTTVSISGVSVPVQIETKIIVYAIIFVLFFSFLGSLTALKVTQ